MRLLTGLSTHLLDVPDAVRVGDATLSGERLLACARAVADDVRGAGVVAVHTVPTAETMVAVVGALLAGVAVVPLPPDSGDAETAHILGDSRASLVLAAPGAALPTTVPLVPVDLRRRSDTGHPAPAPGDAALIMYTSGTTGAPKGVLLSHAALEAGLDALVDAWQWSPDDHLVHGLPLFHVHGLVLGVLGVLRVGCRLTHTVRPRPEAYAAAGGSMYFGVPTVWSRICADPGSARALAGSRLLVSGSAALPVPVFHRLHELTGHRPVERYGMTETLITLSGRADGDRRPGQVGLPLPGVDTRVLDDAGQQIAADGETVGDLWVRGPMLFDGYLHQPEATAAQRDGDWFRTGDIAAVGPDGWHRIAGRRSTDLIKSGGYRVGAGEVENALLAHPAVREAAVVGTPHDDLGQQITAYVVAETVDAADLIDFVARTLSAHKRPREVRFVAELPRNAMGKVQKALLH
ncbi:acyl-CoA synthetase [Micromonospora rosaria]|uniref:Acyl-CoA synthetase n=1 Tax=Micromonospora rosaria TaxID=47874 RepID=A0A136PYX2_9ACTN|nr:acyl-CoA synthetase [Micromonospora rosaria]KXK63669.1 acyl-CoA synthetase [Micromonospora rosaria]